MRFLRAIRVPSGYALAALVFTWPLALDPVRSIASVQGPGDTYLNLWILGWDLRTLATEPSAILTGQVFNANIFHPATNTLAYSDHFLLQSLVVAPLYFVTGNPVLCYNAVLFLSLVAAAWAMHVTVRELVGSETAAWTAGLAWGFAPYHFGHLIHLQLQALYFLPLVFLFWHRMFTTGRTRDACALGASVAAMAIASVYYAVIGTLAIVVAVIVRLIAGADAVARLRLLRQAALAALIGAILVAPIAYRYLAVQRTDGFGRSLAEASQGAAGLRAYITVAPDNLVYGRTGFLPRARPEDRASSAVGPRATEQVLFPGFVLTVLAAIGVWRSWKYPHGRHIAVVFLLIGAVGFLLSLGPEGVRALYAAAHRFVFGFQAIRAPARFGVLVLFALIGLAAFAMRDLARWRPRIAVAVFALVAVEYLNAPLPYVSAPPLETSTAAWLRNAPERGAVMYQPLTTAASVTTPFMVQSLVHRRPLLNGYSGLRPAYYDGLAQAMAAFPSPETIQALDNLDVRFVVTPAPLDIRDLPLVERARFDDGVVYEVQGQPAAGSNRAGPRLSTLPPLGALPFAAGETAVYSVVWTTGPLAIPAARVTFQVNKGQHGAKFDLSAHGTTAPWVSRFFEADDRFASSVDEALRPLTVEQRLREGSRSVDRRATFDRASGVVRLQQGLTNVAVPASPDALDPIAAFYYLRAVHDALLQMSVNDWGREISVTVPPGVPATITVGGVTVETIRLDPHLVKRSRQPVSYRLTVCLSRDSRRVPILMTIDGLVGVGSVRFELESFVAGAR